MTLGVVDQIALGDLVARYALHADRREIDAMSDLFTEDAVLVLPDAPEELDPVRVFTGRSEIAATLSVLDQIPVTFHALAGQVFGGAGARHGHREIACVAHHMTSRDDGKVSDLVWHCRYTDTYRLDGQTWRIARREQRIDSIETRPVRRWRGE